MILQPTNGGRFVSAKRLPDGYQEVEYLQSSGAGYIDSGYAFTKPELKIEFKYMKLSTLSTSLFGVAFGSNPKYAHGHINGQYVYTGNSSSKINFSAGTQSLSKVYEGSSQINGTTSSTQKLTLNLNGGSQIFSLSSSSKMFSGTQYTDYILATRSKASGTASSLFNGRLYYIRFYNNTMTKVRDFVPCYRVSDGKIGLYDLCESVCSLTGTPFYINSGTGSFTKGQDIF